jgi:3'-5' exoribonuclease
MLVSHHGQYEFGSPKLPMFREALLLHYLDDLDSKMGAMRLALDSSEGEGNWTGYSGALERRLLRADRFLAGSGASIGKKSSAQALSGGGSPSDGNE